MESVTDRFPLGAKGTRRRASCTAGDVAVTLFCSFLEEDFIKVVTQIKIKNIKLVSLCFFFFVEQKYLIE